MEFKKGDIVYLKSGSPAMTIDAIEDNIANCIWFDKKQNIQIFSFALELLTSDVPDDVAFGLVDSGN